MSDALTITDLQTAKKHDTFHSEVITGKAGGSAIGAEIDTSTNAVTGQVQTTLPKILRDVGFKPASFNFVTGGTLGVADADKCIYNPAPAGDDNWYSWGGALPHAVAPGADPTAVGSGYVPRTDIVLRGELAAIDGDSLLDLATYAVIRSYSGGGSVIRCRGKNHIFDGGHGTFDLDETDSSSIDNGFTVLVDASGRRWKRRFSGDADMRWAADVDSITDQTAAMQLAIDTFAGVIRLAAGDWLHSGLILRNKYCSLIGSGQFATRLKLKDSSNVTSITITNTCSLIMLKDLMIEGNKAQNTIGHGIEVQADPVSKGRGSYPYGTAANNQRDIDIRNVVINGPAQDGLRCNKINYFVDIDKVHVIGAGRDGFYISMQDFTFNNCIAEFCQRHAMWLDTCGSARVHNAKLIWAGQGSDATSLGLKMNACTNMQMSNIEVQDCGYHGAEFTGLFECHFANLSCNRNGFKATNTYYGLRIGSCAGLTINGFSGLNYVAASQSEIQPAGTVYDMGRNQDCFINGSFEGCNHWYSGTINSDNNLVKLGDLQSEVVFNNMQRFTRTRISHIGVPSAYSTISFQNNNTNTPSYVANGGVTPYQFLSLSYTRKDRIRLQNVTHKGGFTFSCVFSPDNVSGTHNLYTVGAYGAGLNYLYAQVIGSQTFQVLLGNTAGNTTIPAIVTASAGFFQVGVYYKFTFGFNGTQLWLSVVRQSDSRRLFRLFNLANDYSAILSANLNNTVFGGYDTGDITCSGKANCVYVGDYSSPTEDVAALFTGWYDGINYQKCRVMMYLDGSVQNPG